ncbi:DUF2807 domain-containing protein [Flavobacterium sp. F372]|uniref:DUF2807 domain-containing protein n=1 Tax=Flavobacterium bernardetii TaxID=2813823 RepID=A0ABR7IUP0_9FLAO|nr:DUF2807 domain-containing protein [Flavobacterium bernardetii]MBC5833491.1 DUF2807 domain-containing protein [Flavobacterium bernardetii]NHF68723.1 DUF2807 domain-containing protein [Flavobacterium bernardetii]
MTKKFTIIVIALFSFTIASAQVKLEKIKGSKIVTISVKEVESFENVEIEEFLDVYFVKSEKQSIEIEADDNLHDIISYNVLGNTLKLTALKQPTGEKKVAIRVNYTDSLKTIVARHDSKINAIADINLENITIKNFDRSQSFLNIRSTNFTLIMTDKSKAEINVKSDKTFLELSKDAKVKGLIASPEAKIDLYQKAEAEIEGDAQIAKIRLDNNSSLIAKKFTVKDMELVAESYTKCSVNAQKSIEISASGKTEIDLLGEPKVDLKVFTNSAILAKKEK